MQSVSQVPDVAVLVSGKELEPAAYAALLDVSVQEDTTDMSACTVRLSAWNDAKAEPAWVDSDTFPLGAEIEIKLGYVGALETLFKGEITAHELGLSAGGAPRFVVSGYDRRQRLARTTRVRTFKDMKDSDIASQIASDAGLTPDTVDSKIKHAYVQQDGKTDLEFLRARAALIGYEVLVDGKILHFRPVEKKEKAVVQLAADTDVNELTLRLSVAKQVVKVEVRGWDPATQKPIVGTASAGQEASMGDTGGPKAAENAFGKSTLVITDRPVATQDEADKIALAALQKLALGFIEADGSCPGRTDLRAGTKVSLSGAGKRFEGEHYLLRTTHTYSAKGGYTTSFSARRNAT